MFDRNIFSERLIELRSSKNVMAKDVAESIGVSKQALSQFEKCASTPSTITLIALADYFNVSLDYLVGRSEEPEVSR